jgi:HD-GYP domain-containing protein (c-di-GMP phosphodiesterase class II)
VRTPGLREEFLDLSALILGASRARTLYPPGHHQVQQSIRSCYMRVRSLLQKHREYRVVLVEDEFVVGRTQVPVKGEVLADLARTFRQAGIGRVAFREGILQWEFERFLALVGTARGALERDGGIEAILEREGVEHVTAGRITAPDQGEGEGDRLVQAWNVYSSAVKTVRRVRQGVRARGRVEHLDELRDLARQLVDVATEDTQPLLTLHSLKVHDDYSFTHSVNVSILTLVIARALEFTPYALHEITLAALLHDIGKERVPDEVLNKRGKLDPDEWEIMNRHGPDGAKILARTPGVGDLAPVVAYEHQLAYETDNPDSGKWPIHVVSQIVCIADIYDALRSVRPYRGELPPDVAMEIMHEEAEKKLDAELFAGFARLVGFYPPGTCVELSSGAIGISCRTNPDHLRAPLLKVVLDGDGNRLDPPVHLDLADPGEDNPFGELVKVVDSEEAGVDAFDYL